MSRNWSIILAMSLDRRGSKHIPGIYKYFLGAAALVLAGCGQPALTPTAESTPHSDFTSTATKGDQNSQSNNSLEIIARALSPLNASSYPSVLLRSHQTTCFEIQSGFGMHLNEAYSQLNRGVEEPLLSTAEISERFGDGGVDLGDVSPEQLYKLEVMGVDGRVRVYGLDFALQSDQFIQRGETSCYTLTPYLSLQDPPEADEIFVLGDTKNCPVLLESSNLRDYLDPKQSAGDGMFRLMERQGERLNRPPFSRWFRRFVEVKRGISGKIENYDVSDILSGNSRVELRVTDNFCVVSALKT